MKDPEILQAQHTLDVMRAILEDQEKLRDYMLLHWSKRQCKQFAFRLLNDATLLGTDVDERHLLELDKK